MVKKHGFWGKPGFWAMGEYCRKDEIYLLPSNNLSVTSILIAEAITTN